jgi:hypothetical protein
MKKRLTKTIPPKKGPVSQGESIPPGKIIESWSLCLRIKNTNVVME